MQNAHGTLIQWLIIIYFGKKDQSIFGTVITWKGLVLDFRIYYIIFNVLSWNSKNIS